MTHPLIPGLLEIHGLRLVRGGREVVSGVDATVGRGELVALMGLSGSGKTTLLRAVAGLDPFEAGRIEVDGLSLPPGARASRATLAALRHKVGMVFQFHSLFEHLTALENVCLAPMHVRRLARAPAEDRARTLLDQLGVAHRAQALPRELSGGEAQRVAIARALAVDPPFLLMDEPTASLDPARRGELGETLVSLAASGRALFITSHDDEFVRHFASRVIVLADGRVAEEGPPRQVLESPSHPATRTLLQFERERQSC